MTRTRIVVGVVLLLAEAALAVLGGVVAFGLTAEYGRVGDSPTEALLGVLGVLVIALVLVGAVGLAAALAGRSRRVTLLAVAVPVLLVAGVWMTGPMALDHKLEVQYDRTPQCAWGELGSGPGVAAAHEAQATFDAIDHVGWFGGGGSTGVDGCDRSLLLTEDTDVVGHYRTTLAADGWTVVEAGSTRLRAEKDGTAFEVRGRDRDWTVWTGPTGRVAP